ncbi:ABC transporter ATP-binding protein [Yinghuangia seranimata]|uniref:ABC transporter ATP-binding protein n=1 Tax=Yinghuangia seranimata TaxID=408067 RepID=UPI00248D129A|nr:ABC transporter ATP-binding protein [Yinghuangia seranimata]MDI2129128.1 ABC transporter ATP-binding protein [Yinghuangia seranimata]
MPIIEVTGLRKAYGSTTAVDGVDLSVAEGEIFGLLGPNGAGKTTTVECVEGLRVPDAGTVRVAGMDPVADRDRVRALLGAQLQECALPAKLTVREALELYAACYPRPADWRDLAERLGLTGHFHVPFAKLSGGRKQRLFIALALIGAPRVVVLDELTTGLDPHARRETWDLIEDVRDRGVSVLLVTHFMAEAERLCDRVAVMDAGRVVALDTPAGLVRRSARGTVVSFTPSRPLTDAETATLPGVRAVRVRGDGQVTIEGSDSTVEAVVALLARLRVTAHQLRVADGTLEGAYLDLTDAGPGLDSGDETPFETPASAAAAGQA